MTTTTTPKTRLQRRNLNVRDGLTALAYLAPALLILGLFSVLPLLDAFRLSFTDWTGFGDPEWIGFANFADLLADPRFRTAFLNNCRMILALPFWVFVPLVIAQAIHAQVPGWRVYRFALFLPSVLSPVVLGIYYGLILSPRGPISSFFRAIGWDWLIIDWLNEPVFAFPILATILIWSSLGIGVIIYLAALANLDGEIIEAARMDGTSWWQLQTQIVFWMLIPVIRFWTVLVFIVSFTGIFPLVFALTRGGPGFSTYVLEFAIYQGAFSSNDLGYASAIGVFLLIFVATMVRLIFWALRDRDA